MLLANWFEISDQDYIWYKLQGYNIDANSDRVVWFLDSWRHREDGPAVIWANGIQEWCLNDKRHRTDGPAVIRASGDQWWYLNGKRHREDGPAVICADGTQKWFLNGKLHRTDGPAIIRASDNQGRCYDREYTEQEWLNAVNELV
jgi:hypothetical protein